METGLDLVVSPPDSRRLEKSSGEVRPETLLQAFVKPRHNVPTLLRHPAQRRDGIRFSPLAARFHFLPELAFGNRLDCAVVDLALSAFDLG